MMSILDDDKNYISNIRHQEISKTLYQNKDKNVKASERREIKDEEINETNIKNNKEAFDNNKFNISKENIILDNGKKNHFKINGKLLSEIGFCDILKSYFCFKDKKTKLVNDCHSIIIEDMCLEKILKRIYSLENISNYYYLKKIKNKRFKMKKSKHKIQKKEAEDRHENKKNEERNFRINNNIVNNI